MDVLTRHRSFQALKADHFLSSNDDHPSSINRLELQRIQVQHALSFMPAHHHQTINSIQLELFILSCQLDCLLVRDFVEETLGLGDRCGEECFSD